MGEPQSPPEHPPSDARHPSRRFCTAQCSNSSMLMPLSASAALRFTSSPAAKRFPLRTFHSGRQKKMSLRARWGEQGGWGTGVVRFLVRNCRTLSTVWAGAPVNHPSQMGNRVERAFENNSPKPNAASHNTTSWRTDADGLLEHSPSRGSLPHKGPALQEVLLGLGGTSSHSFSSPGMHAWKRNCCAQEMYVFNF
ncbi:hypothetical protein HJG60_010731 [Phyllostomus discolor]|uniref:Uncharacterized protein n=1 Tax=Phyllostomus discolor TaxID=89673 RepID=A0A834EBJ9_9CHIR|nr:hypothetical protein HJG60_010731 [Phyllostomus discolor]